MGKKLGVYLLSATLLANLFFASVVKAAEGEEVIDEKWGSPTFVYGSALNAEQVQKTKEILAIDGKSNIVSLSISGKDMVRLLGGGNPNANMYSSALIEGNEKGGVVVEILTPENITKVSMNQYANALITAGATDVSVQVASPVKVTGESALTGVYLAYEDKGVELDETAMNVAQEELGVVTDISQDLQGTEGYDDELLNMALIHIKQELANAKAENAGALPDEVIQQVVNDSLAEYGLDTIVTAEQVAQLTGLAASYVNLDNLFTPEMQAQLEQLATDVTAKAKELAGDVAGKIGDTLSDEGFWEGVKNFFVGIIDWIAALFVSDTPEQEPTAVNTEFQQSRFTL